MPADLVAEITGSFRRLAALHLWQLGAVRVSLEHPFRLVSGNYSPIYINCRQLISSPAFGDLFAAAARSLCTARAIEFDVVAGGETAGIPFAAILAKSVGKPMIYVRKAAKQHGLSTLIEGMMSASDRVLLTEDLITDAGSKIHFVNAIEEAGAQVAAVLVVFDRLQGGQEALAKRNIPLLAISDVRTALVVAQEARLLSAEEVSQVSRYLESPQEWHAKRSLEYRA